MEQISIGSVIQINERFPNPDWIGAFLIVTKITSEGIQGYMYVVEDPKNSGYAFVNCKYDEVEYIGQARIICTQDTRNN